MTITPSEIHPELRRVAGLLPKLHFSPSNLWLWHLLDRLRLSPRAPRNVRVRDLSIPRPQGGAALRVRVYQPVNAVPAMPLLLWLHGGGYLIGNPNQDDTACIQYALDAGCVVVSPDYALSPAHPFPAARDDALTALRWALTPAAGLDVAVERVAIGGASAGGGLAAALVQHVCDLGEIPLRFQLLVYPMLDDRTVLRAGLNAREFLAWTPAANRFGWQSYLNAPPGSADVPAGAVPARRTDLRGLPPAWIGVGTLDLFYDEDAAYAARLRECGVPCEFLSVPGAFHGFDVAGVGVPVIRDFRAAQVAALRTGFGERE